MPSLTDVISPSLASTTRCQARDASLQDVADLVASYCHRSVCPDLRSGHRGLKLLKMAANAVVDDAIAHPDHKSADEAGSWTVSSGRDAPGGREHPRSAARPPG